MSVSIKNSQFAKDGIHVTYSDNSSQNITFNNKLLTLDKALSVAGNATVSGLLASTTVANLNAVNISGDTSSSGALTVAGLTTVNNNLNVNGVTTLGNNLSVSGDSTVSQNSTVGGVLAVTGVSNLNNKLNVADDAEMKKELKVVGSSYLSTLNASGDASIGGQLNVTGVSTLGNNLNVSGNSVLTGTLNVGENVGMSKNLNIGGLLTVTGATSLSSSLAVSAAATFNNKLSVVGESNLAVLKVSEDATLSKKLNVTDVTTLGNNLTVSGVSNLNNNLNVTGAASLGNGLSVTGLSTLSGAAVVSQGLSVAANSHVSSSFGGDVSMGQNLTVTGTLGVTGESSFGAKVSAHSAEVTNGLTVNGGTTLNGALSVNSNTTFGQNVTVGGNLTVLGQTTSIQTTSLEVKDSAILIANGNQSDLIDTGVDIQYKSHNSGVPLYAGLKRRAGTGEFVLFQNSNKKIDQPAPSIPIDIYGEYFQFDLGSSKKVNTYGLRTTSYPVSEGILPPQLIKWTLLGSNDEKEWNIVERKDNNYSVQQQWSSNDRSWSNFDISTVTNRQYQYWRFVLEKYGSSGAVGKDQASYYNFAAYMKGEDGNYLTPNYDNTKVSPSLLLSGGQPVTPSAAEFFQKNFIRLITSDVQPDHHSIRLSPGMTADPYPNNFYAGSVTTSTFEVGQTVDQYAVLLADSFNCASDMNLKKNVVPLDGALNKIDHIRGVYHDWIDEKNDEHAIGVIAQEVQAVYPELVRHGADGYLSVNYPKLTAVLLQALKELKALVLSKQ